jgi:hypothetical protein
MSKERNLYGMVLSAARREEKYGMRLYISLHALHSADEKDVRSNARHKLSTLFPQKDGWVGHNFDIAFCNPNLVNTVVSSAARPEPYQLHFLGMSGIRVDMASPVFEVTKRASLTRPTIVCRGLFHLTNQLAVKTVEEVLVNRLHHEFPAAEFPIRLRDSMKIELSLNIQDKGGVNNE